MFDEKPALRVKLTFAVFVIILGAFTALNRVITPPEVSQSERRTLAAMPAFTWKSVTSASFMDGFEDFAADSFVFRDALRSVRAATVFYPFMQTDKDGLYLGAFGAGKFTPLDETSARQTAAKIRKAAEALDGLNVYYSVIPDKSVYAERNYPSFDVDAANAILAEELPEVTRVDLYDSLDNGSFYRTDLHWDQSRLSGVAEKLGSKMDFEYDAQTFYSETAGEFQGVYAGQLALPVKSDVLTYLIPSGTLTARYLNEKTLEWEYGEMYDLDAFSGRDPYDLFLRGAQPLIVIENANSNSERELYLFRDSFASSLAPLLTATYRKITLIDLRYINFAYLPEFVTFERGSDALFLYSSQILNSPAVLQVQ
ncbi:MAG: hypothetical protein LBN43_09605 [Oscillospiraceae bacterium]|jgi:hypothetical protein|nr:hypothetical protein [Oscillospiraceae bacterium]